MLDRARPGIDAAVEIDQTGIHLILQKVDDLLTTHPVMTDDNNFSRIRKFRDALRDLPHRQVIATFNMADVEFPGFSDVEQ